MMTNNRILASLALVLALSNPSATLGAAEGTAVGVNPDAVARINRADRTLVVGADLSVGETVMTGPRGQVQIVFHDQTRLVVGPGSSLMIETYLLRGGNTAEKLTVNALAGTFRFISGRSPKSAYQIRTPTAAIGVRGTKFDIVVARGSTRVMLYEGALQICGGGQDCEQVTERCELGAAGSGGTRLYTRNDPDRLPLAADFYYARFQTPLISGFRVSGAAQCLEPTSAPSTPTPITELGPGGQTPARRDPGGGNSGNQGGGATGGGTTGGTTSNGSTGSNTPGRN
jgi:hypothetical protein